MSYSFTLICLLCITFQVGFSQQVRYAERINFDWKFTHQTVPEAYTVTYNDSKWQKVNLPHDASINGPFLKDSLNSDRKNGFRPRRKGWYRKELILDSVLVGKKVFLRFEGIYRDARVYLNGKELAHQLNGFEEFEVDITSTLSRGKNYLAVSYDNTDMQSSRWYNGEGIYRDAWLIVTSDVYVIKDGTYITTPHITENECKVEIATEVHNDSSTPKIISLISQVFDHKHQLVGEVTDVVPLAVGERYRYHQVATLAHPRLWNIDSPHLYTVKSLVTEGGKVLDEYTTPFGIRTIQFDRDQGLLLNGQKLLVKGVNIHHDLGPLGVAAFERGFERRLEGLKRLGCNAIRLAHNPHDTYILDWCDKNGMLVFDEAFDKWDDQFFGEGNSFTDHWQASLAAFIKRDRNHPSVFIWSVGNETRQQRSAKDGYGVPMMKAMADFVHKLDPSRSVTAGLHPSRARGAYRTAGYYREGPPEMEFYMDVVSTNYREEFWPVDRAHYPQLTFILSEAQVGNLGNEWFNFNHDYGVGLFYWGGTDYIGESFGWPAKGWPNGIIDWNDHWKPFSYYIQSLFSEEPMVHIAAYDLSEQTEKYWNEVKLRYQPMFSHWNWQGKDSVRLLTMSNAAEVELLVNGHSVGIKSVPEAYQTRDIKAYTAEEYDPDNPINTGPPMHHQLEWVIPYEQGEIKAIARTNDKDVATHALNTAGEPYRITLEADRHVIQADGLDLAYCTVKVVDRQGIVVPGAENDIHFKVRGVGTIAGVGNADVLSEELFQADHRKVFQGQALLILRAENSPGTIVVEAYSEGLKGAKATIQVK